jgi:ElaB/YqjD/DUF883 family membrane-anchored ribosome-binding protein
MRTINEIRKDIDTLLDEAEQVIVNSKEVSRQILAHAMLISLRKKVKDQFINIKQYLKA